MRLAVLSAMPATSGPSRCAASTFVAAHCNVGLQSIDLVYRDSDRDGFTNGMELGDPCCVWTQGKTPAYTYDLSHPANATSKPWTRKPPTCPGNPCGGNLRG
jgi:hypothetical protein